MVASLLPHVTNEHITSCLLRPTLLPALLPALAATLPQMQIDNFGGKYTVSGQAPNNYATVLRQEQVGSLPCQGKQLGFVQPLSTARVSSSICMCRRRSSSSSSLVQPSCPCVVLGFEF